MTRTLRWGLLLGLFGCELVVNFDRSRVPEAGVDGGAMDAGSIDAGAADTGGGDDAGAMDASVDDDAGMDASVDDDAGAMDASVDDDAGMDASVDDDAGMDASIDDDAGMDASIDDDAGMDDAGMDAGPECTMASECDDSIACTADDCTDDRCVYTPVDSACDDGDACTADSCSATTGCESEPICGVSAPAIVVLDDLTTVLVLPSVEAAVAGHVVIYTDEAGMPSTTAIGSATVTPGTSADVMVELTRPAVDGETLHARLHLDDGNGMFEGAAIDVPATLGGMPVVSAFEVDIPTGTPDLELRISAGDGTDYTFAAGRPSTFASNLPTGTNPSLTLLRGFRYRLVNAALAHPFAFVSTGDVEQLSQSSMAALEADANIAWLENEGDVLFTVSPEFEVVTDYLCTAHPSLMRGTVTYAD